MDQEYHNKSSQLGKEYTSIELLHGKTSNSAKIIPESFVRGGPNLTEAFLVDEGRENPNTSKSGPSSAYQQNAFKMAFCWRVDGGSTLNASLVAL